MSLTMGAGPFGHVPAGRFNIEVQHEGVVYVEPFPRRIRAVLGGETVFDTRRAHLLWESGRLPRYFIPRDDVRSELLDAVPAVEPPAGAVGVDGFVAFPWDALDAWYEEDEEVVGHAP